MSITSDDVNYLVYRYLMESGFTHSAFLFKTESAMSPGLINDLHATEPGALISFLQKGLQYHEIETHVKEDGSEIKCDAPFSLTRQHVCKETGDNDGLMEDAPEVLDKHVSRLVGHEGEVFCIAWHPKQSILATGSGDATARIWNIPPGIPSGKDAAKAAEESCMRLDHSSGRNMQQKDVTTMDWNPDGTMLATGSYNGVARMYDLNGKLLSEGHDHGGPIFTVSWSPSGKYLLSGSVDKTAIVWDRSGKPVQTFKCQAAPVLDVHWRDDSCFATAATDGVIMVCDMDKKDATHVFKGHKDEVNAIQWDPSRELLASASDDKTSAIWRLGSEEPVFKLEKHEKEVYTVRWSPVGRGTQFPNRPVQLATASFDTTVLLWDVASGTVAHHFKKHSDPVYSIAFSPDGNLLATASFDRALHIWSTKDGSLVRTYRSHGGLFDVAWNHRGDKVAVASSNMDASIIDIDLRR